MNSNRYFIVGIGRTGSSLLSAILSDSGGNFGLNNVRDWDKSSGAFEHPDIIYISKHFRRASYLTKNKRSNIITKYNIDVRKHLAKSKAKKILKKVQYVKSDNLDLWVWYSIKMGYKPKIIISYRNFFEVAQSLYVMTGLNFIDSEAQYIRIYENCLLMMSVYGGCIVNYDDLIDFSNSNWAKPLSSLTNINFDKLIRSRDNRVKIDYDNTKIDKLNYIYSSRIKFLEKKLFDLSGTVFDTSKHLKRVYEKNKMK